MNASKHPDQLSASTKHDIDTVLFTLLENGLAKATQRQDATTVKHLTKVKIELIREIIQEPRRIDRYTRCRRNQRRELFCPECNGTVHVGHFEWSALGCLNCNAMVSKYRWQLNRPYTSEEVQTLEEKLEEI